jgi:glucose-1-phosphatase
MIEVVVFDMDDVLTRYRIERRLALLSSWSSRSPEEIRAAIWESGFEGESERGEWSADHYLRGFGERMGYPLTAEEWVRARRESMEPNEPLLAIARRLSRQLPVAMFTNNGFLLKRHFAEVFPTAAELFGERAVFSADVGASKPSPHAFARLAARLGVAPAGVLFFDDSAAYVEGARQAGLHAHQYADVESLLAHLDEHGLGAIARG